MKIYNKFFQYFSTVVNPIPLVFIGTSRIRRDKQIQKK